MSLRCILLFFGVAHSFGLLSKNLQGFVNQELMPSDLVKIKAANPNWRGEEIFEKITKVARLFTHKETNEIILESKEKTWTEIEIIDELGYRPDEFKMPSAKTNGSCARINIAKKLIETKDWNKLFARGIFRTSLFKKYWTEALAEITDINEKYENGRTVLMRAVTLMDPCDDVATVIKILVGRGADVHEKNNYGRTALHYAAYWNRIEAIEVLLELEAEIDATNNSEETPLMIAVRCTSIDAVKVLLERGARLDMKNEDRKTAIDIAKSYRDRSVNRPGLGIKRIIELLESQQNQVVLEKKQSENIIEEISKNEKTGCEKCLIV